MDFKEALYNRRAIRQFTDESVDELALRALIDAAIQAPSAVNQQPWHFSVVRDKALFSRISRAAKGHLSKTSPVAWASPHSQDLLTDPNFNIFYDAPVLIVISAKAESLAAVADCALAAENLMLSACAAGLGTCWIGFAQDWLATPEGKSALKIPESCLPVAPIIVGHPKASAPPVPRKQPTIDWLD